MSDSVTILQARGRRLCKTIAADGTIAGYDSATTFDMREREVGSIADLRGVLTDLAGRADRCLVRAAIADPSRTRGVRRLLHDDGETGDRATLVDAPRRWVALDIDGMPLPKGCDTSDIFSCGIAAIMSLPQEFRGAEFIAQATASHGIKPGMHLRLWCWLSRPTSGAELAAWCRGAPHLDRAAFSAGQVIYVAIPIFEAPRVDHLPQRLCVVPGPPVVQVPPPEALRPPPPPPPRAMPMPVDDRKRRYASAALRRAAERIATSAEGNRHATIRREASSLFRLARAALITNAELRGVIAGAAAIAGENDAREIESLLAWAASHVSTAPIPEGARDGR